MAPVLPNHDKEALKNIESTFDGNGKIKSSKPKNGLLPKILSVLAALALWMYVFQAVEEDLVFKEIPISVENFNTSLDLDVVSGYENTLDVTVSGTKSVINDIVSSDIRASVDMSGITERGTYVLDVMIQAPTNIKIVDKSVTQIRISVDKTIEKTVELAPELSYNIQYPYSLGDTTMSATSVTLKGPETDINAVSRATVRLNLGSIKNNILSNVPVTLYDTNNYEIQSKFIIVSPSSVEVSIPVYKTALFSVQPEVVMNSNRYTYTVTPASVYLKGTVNDIDAQSVLKTERAWIDGAGEYELALLLPENVYAYTGYNALDQSLVQKVKLMVTELPTPVLPTDETVSAGAGANG